MKVASVSGKNVHRVIYVGNLGISGVGQPSVKPYGAPKRTAQKVVLQDIDRTVEALSCDPNEERERVSSLV